MQIQTDSIRMYSALEKTLAITGESCKKVTLFQLRNEYGISPTSRTCFTMRELENALAELFGQGAALVIKQLKLELET
jgi:hypothetical protein